MPVEAHSGTVTGEGMAVIVGALFVGQPDALKQNLVTTASFMPARAFWNGPAGAIVWPRPSAIVVHAAYTTSSFGTAIDIPSRGGSTGSGGHTGGSPGRALEKTRSPVEGCSTDTKGLIVFIGGG